MATKPSIEVVIAHHLKVHVNRIREIGKQVGDNLSEDRAVLMANEQTLLRARKILQAVRISDKFELRDTAVNIMHLSQTDEHTRAMLKEGLEQLDVHQRRLFTRIYSPDDLEEHINVTIDNIPADKLAWAMHQVKTTFVAKDPEG